MQKRFATRIIPAIAAFSLTASLLCSCSDDKDGNLTTVAPTSADSTGSDSTAVDSTTLDSTTSDTTAKDSSTTDSTAKDFTALRTISGFINRGQYDIGTEVVLREIDSTLAQTGTVYRGTITDGLGAYSIPDVKLTQPYVHLEVTGRFNSFCYESDSNYPMFYNSVEAYADIRKGDSVDVNILTYLQAKRLPLYMERGMSLDSAMTTAQAEISTFLMLDTLREDFNKLNLGTAQSDNYYLLGATVLAEGFLFNGNLDSMIISDLLTDGVAGPAWINAHSAAYNTDCFKLAENTKSIGYSVALGTARTFLKDVWEEKAKMGACTAENYNEIKATAFDSSRALYCDSTKWNFARCEQLDNIALSTTFVGDTTAGHLNPSPYCEERFYFWENSSWNAADNVDAGLGLACVAGTAELYGKSGKKCYHCNGRYWEDVEATECDEHEVSVEAGK